MEQGRSERFRTQFVTIAEKSVGKEPGMTSYELRVTSYELRVMSYELRVMNAQLLIENSFTLGVTSTTLTELDCGSFAILCHPPLSSLTESDTRQSRQTLKGGD